MQGVLMKASHEMGALPSDHPGIKNTPSNTPLIFRNSEATIGTTEYDLQSNYSGCKRISKSAEGNIMTVWTMGFEETGYPDRGTGYNISVGGSWDVAPSERLEDGIRTGWPNHVVTASGKELIVNHVFTPGIYGTHILRRNASSDPWIAEILPTTTPFGIVWPRSAVGGTDGETIHVIGVTLPVANGGVVYEGVDLHILYYRSTDGGATWDITDRIIPGLDASLTTQLQAADSYFIDARGENVAIGLFNQWTDILLFKSTDNGDTWTKTIVKDFPIDQYLIDQGYTIEDLPPYDENQPDSLAIFTSDNSGTVLLDHSGVAHVFYGQMYVLDDDLTDGQWTYFPATSGLAYWNESYASNEIRTIADVVDRNGNDTLDVGSIDELATYFTSLTSFASAGIDAAGNLFVVYAGLIEGEDFINQEDGQFYRHIYAIASSDGGETWTEPLDLIAEEFVQEPDLVNFIEALHPSLIREVGDNLELIYQQDFRPGWIVRGDMDPVETNFINFMEIDKALLVDVSTKEVVSNAHFKLQTLPNPTSGAVQISFDLAEQAAYQVGIFDLMGKSVLKTSSNGIGLQQLELDLSDLPKGIYMLRLQTQGQTTAMKMVVE
ncbi:MAG TPA: T9SS type A sorting domain-containing protein [Saprospiraceae bacterium]|nr:T9SS type A sorting domain-containing protein [Saprospiraceae bacterium]HMQ81298.1 T9SS type A sorting domain-containing protein [Saprospiraceae bacterium]